MAEREGRTEASAGGRSPAASETAAAGTAVGVAVGSPAAGPVREWDAASYDRVADPQARWGTAVLERLPRSGVGRILDAGCGTGRVTEQLLARLPDAHVIALDGSAAMLDVARRRLAAFGERVEFVHADLGLPLPIAEPVDAVVSTATFHWVPDHGALFGHLADVLRPGGMLVAQFGGEGNIARVRAVLATIGDGWSGPAHYESVPATRARLEAAGFEAVDAWLEPQPTSFEPGEPFHAFLRTVILGPQLARLPAGEREPFVREVAARLGRPEIDYVRLNVVARRARS